MLNIIPTTLKHKTNKSKATLKPFEALRAKTQKALKHKTAKNIPKTPRNCNQQ